MPAAHGFLQALAVVLAVAACTTVLCARLRAPVVVGYLLAGLVVGPHVKVPLVADPQVVQTLSELGVILLMFGIGLEFSLRKLVRVAPVAGLTGLFESSVMMWLGFLVGRALGFTALESVFAGAMVAISSTTVVVKAFDDHRIGGALRDLAVGVLLVEDLFAVLLLAVLTGVATGAALSPGALAGVLGKLAGFLAALLAVGMLVIPRAVRAVARLGRPETLLVASLGICFAVALLAGAAGYSVALGAFLAGALAAESGVGHTVERLVRPVRDLFAAIFFVSVGMLIDPALVWQHLPAVLAFLVLVLLARSAAVAIGAVLAGRPARLAAQAGLSLAQIGEFSFILAGLGAALGATRPFLLPVAVAVSALTALTTPWLVGASAALAERIERALPARIQTVLSLYGSWLEQIRASPRQRTLGAHLRRLVRATTVDALLVTALVVGAALGHRRGAAALRTWASVSEPVARWGLLALATLAALPFAVGVVLNGRRIGLALATAALPRAVRGRPDLAAAPRRALLVVLQLAAALLVLLPIAALTQPFLPGVPAAAVLLAAVALLAVAFWRSAADLQGHVRAGAQVIVEALARQAEPRPGSLPAPEGDALAPVRALFPGLGEPVLARIAAASPAAGRTLGDVGVRGRTGATVLALRRAGGEVLVPTAETVLLPGDVLAMAGSGESVREARTLLDAQPVER